MASEYHRAYFRGLIAERRAAAAEWLREAMDRFAEAEPRRPAVDEAAILRWNTCARLLERHPDLAAPRDERDEPLMSE